MKSMKYISIFVLVLLISACKTEPKANTSLSDSSKMDVITPAKKVIEEVEGQGLEEVTQALEAVKEVEAMDKASDFVKNKTENVVQEKAKEVKEKVKEIKPDKVVKVENVTSENKEQTKPIKPSGGKPVVKTIPEKEQVVEQVPVVKESGQKPVVRHQPEPTQTVESVPTEDSKTTKISHQDFDEILSEHVSSSGKVNYKGIKSQVNKLDGYLAQLEAADLSVLSKKEKFAFWINAYNAFTIKKILNNYPLKSITDLDGGKPWDKKWIKLDGQNLYNIENDIIRPKFNEPRIHFAVNCAAKSCPPLLNKAWTADNLESNFAKQTKAFLASSQNKISEDKIQLSKIFEWYSVDFKDLIGFVNKYGKVKVSPSAKVEYLEYDWSLNE